TAILQDLRPSRILLGRYVIELLEQRHVDIAFDIACRAGVSIPVPSPAEVAGLLDDAKILDAGFPQSCCCQQTTKASADYNDINALRQSGSRKSRLDIGVIQEMRVLTFRRFVLRRAFRVQ